MVVEVRPGGMGPGITEQELIWTRTRENRSDRERPEFPFTAGAPLCPTVDMDCAARFHPTACGFQREDFRQPISLMVCRGRLTGHDDPQGGRVRDNISEASIIHPTSRLWHPPTR